MSGVLHLLFNMYTSMSTLASAQGGILVFNTYLLISGHMRGHGCGHLGHGGQYTDLLFKKPPEAKRTNYLSMMVNESS